jgi:hypothetical protein
MSGAVTPGGTEHVILHFTHVNNLSGILDARCLRADNQVDRGAQLQVEAADLGIKQTRREKPVPLDPYGCVADYVPFYFAPRSPMLYKLYRGGVPTYTGGQDALVYLTSTAEIMASAGLRCLFSDGNCAAAVTRVEGDLTLLDSMVDWEVMQSRMWNNTAEDPDRMRRRMAEFLVYQQVSLDCFLGMVVRTEGMRKTVSGLLTSRGSTIQVSVKPDWYF